MLTFRARLLSFAYRSSAPTLASRKILREPVPIFKKDISPASLYGRPLAVGRAAWRFHFTTSAALCQLKSQSILFPCGRSNVPRYLEMMPPPRFELGQFPTLSLPFDSHSYSWEYS